MRAVNQCPKCAAELALNGVCPNCLKSSEASAILMPLNGRRMSKKAMQISSACGAVILLLTAGIGAAFTFHEEIVDGLRGTRIPDPAEARSKARESVDKALRSLEKDRAARAQRSRN